MVEEYAFSLRATGGPTIITGRQPPVPRGAHQLSGGPNRGDELKSDSRNGLGESARPWTLYSDRQRWGFLAILFFVTTSSYFDYDIIAVLLEPIKHEFHVSDTKLGLLSGFCFALFYALSALPIARWADRGNRRTVITVALTGWSVMTAVCGLAQSFWQLALGRLGIGLVEPGAQPPTQSLVVDYFPPERRALALAILTSGSSAGYLIGVGLGGYIAAIFGWRIAFLLVGGPGLLLAIIVRFFVAEPRCQLGFPISGAYTESLSQSFRHLRRKRSFVWTLMGISLYTIFAFGVGAIFVPSFMIRTLHATLEQVSLIWGGAISVANLIGALVGGWLADRLSRRDIRWYVWLPASTCALGAPLYWLALSTHRLEVFVFPAFLAEFVLSMGICVSFVAIHAVCGNSRRTTAIAIVQLSYMLIGAGFGPLIAGALSDAFSAWYGVDSLRYSLTILVAVLVPAAGAFYLAGRALPRELEA